MWHLDPEIQKRLKGHYEELPFMAIGKDIELADDVTLSYFVNLWGCKIGRGTSIGAFTEIGRGVEVGENCKIAAMCFLPPGIHIGNNVFIGPGVVFTNDRYPKADSSPWKCEHTYVNDGASIGARCVILPGVSIGAGSMIGAGSIVHHDIKPYARYRNVIQENTSFPFLLNEAEKGTNR